MKIIQYSSVYNVANNRVGPTEPALNGVTELWLNNITDIIFKDVSEHCPLFEEYNCKQKPIIWLS